MHSAMETAVGLTAGKIVVVQNFWASLCFKQKEILDRIVFRRGHFTKLDSSTEPPHFLSSWRTLIRLFLSALIIIMELGCLLEKEASILQKMR